MKKTLLLCVLTLNLSLQSSGAVQEKLPCDRKLDLCLKSVGSGQEYISTLESEKNSLTQLTEKYKAQRDEANARASEWHPDHTVWFFVVGLLGVGAGVALERGVLSK